MHIGTSSCLFRRCICAISYQFEQQYGASDGVIFQGAKLYLIYNCYCGQSSRSQLQCYRQSNKGLFIQLQAKQQVSVGYSDVARYYIQLQVEQQGLISCRQSSRGWVVVQYKQRVQGHITVQYKVLSICRQISTKSYRFKSVVYQHNHLVRLQAQRQSLSSLSSQQYSTSARPVSQAY